MYTIIITTTTENSNTDSQKILTLKRDTLLSAHDIAVTILLFTLNSPTQNVTVSITILKHNSAIAAFRTY